MNKYIANGVIIFIVLSLHLFVFAAPAEQFFITKHQPKPFTINLALARIVIWRPWPFVSVSFGWMLGNSSKFKALQMYIGIKCDGTKTHVLMKGGQPSYVMVLTPKELAAVRIHDINRVPVWNNQGGT
jgi:hypothetical protein